ncbi:Conserved_hypothetical protein [Hexamita inflata]|uniref:Uncharacterized protein n=1 Tax=Hexamita inflata TaxID=28002 RepID=A0AA86RCJ0_9EUKA|nr:Conserved hypothetical protein [Hexamita inflata]
MIDENSQNILNQEYDAKMTHKYENKIHNGSLEIGDLQNGDPEVTNLKFLEKFNIQTLTLFINNLMSFKLRNGTIKELIFKLPISMKHQVVNWTANYLELETLEILDLQSQNLENNQLYNIAKFKKLRTLDVSENNVDLTHIHVVTSLTKLFMYRCDLKDINQIAPLINLEVLNVSSNKFNNINSICNLVHLKELKINWNNQLDITPLRSLVSLIKLDLGFCGILQLSALKPLINLQDLDIQGNSKINITELQYLKNLTHLNLIRCDLVSICVLRPLLKLQNLDIAYNEIVYLDANFNEMEQLEELRVYDNLVSDFSSLEKYQKQSDKINKYGDRTFKVSNQRKPSKKQLRYANKMRHIEVPNVQLKEIQNKNKTYKTIFNNFKQEANEVVNNARSHQIQFTSSVVHFFQLMNQFGFE